jgi:arylsulfatase A-like enzyme
VNQRQLTRQERDHLVGLYDGEVLWADSFVGDFYEAMERGGHLDRSILVFTSDHGEDLYDRHRHFGHGCSIYDSVLHVPLIFRLPGARLAGSRLDAVVGLVDLVPTILDVLGIEGQDGFDGESLFPLLFSDGEKDFPAVISEHYRRRQPGEVLSIRTKRWRYIYNANEVIPYCVPPTALYRIAKEELYDHQSDPLETRNVAESFPEVTRRLREELLTQYPPGEEKRPANMATDTETLERLRSLGYIAE